MAQKGNAAIKYDAGAGTVTVALDWPLLNPEPAEVRRRYYAESLDGTAREVLEIGSGVHEITAEIRFQESAPDLLTALAEGASGVQLDYYPDTVGSPSTFYPCQLMEPTGDRISLPRDQDRGVSHGEFSVAVRLRRLDGGTFDALL